MKRQCFPSESGVVLAFSCLFFFACPHMHMSFTLEPGSRAMNLQRCMNGPTAMLSFFHGCSCSNFVSREFPCVLGGATQRYMETRAYFFTFVVPDVTMQEVTVSGQSFMLPGH